MLTDPTDLAAYRHADPAALQSWAMTHPSPAEELMAREEPEEEPVSFAGMFRLVLVYCFSDAQAGGWSWPLKRATAIVRELLPGECYARASMGRAEVPFSQPVFGLDRFAELLAEESCAERYLRQVMRYVLPLEGNGWEKDAARRLFLLAKAWLPEGVSEQELSRDKVRWVVQEMSYEDLAITFGEMPADAGTKERGRARARWCALKSRFIEQPGRARGVEISLHFSKSATTRNRCRAAQMGNKNRKGKGSAELTHPESKH